MDWTRSFAWMTQVTGLVLLVAGILKVYAAAASPDALLSPSASLWISAVLAGCEMAFGCWMLAGTHPRATRRLAMACFLIFLGVSIMKALAGESTCGCFGPVPVNPWATAVLDGFLLVALWWVKPAEGQGPSGRRWAVFTLLVAASGTVIAAVLVLAQPVRPSADGGGDNAVVVLRPEEWVGRALPADRTNGRGRPTFGGRMGGDAPSARMRSLSKGAAAIRGAGRGGWEATRNHGLVRSSRFPKKEKHPPTQRRERWCCAAGSAAPNGGSSALR